MSLPKSDSLKVFLSWTISPLTLSPAEAKDFSSSLCIQTGSEAHPLCPMCTGGPFLGAKVRPERDADHSHLSSAEDNKEDSMAFSGTALLFTFLWQHVGVILVWVV
jgi:hypothetical protein